MTKYMDDGTFPPLPLLTHPSSEGTLKVFIKVSQEIAVPIFKKLHKLFWLVTLFA